MSFVFAHFRRHCKILYDISTGTHPTRKRELTLRVLSWLTLGRLSEKDSLGIDDDNDDHDDDGDDGDKEKPLKLRRLRLDFITFHNGLSSCLKASEFLSFMHTSSYRGPFWITIVSSVFPRILLITKNDLLSTAHHCSSHITATACYSSTAARSTQVHSTTARSATTYPRPDHCLSRLGHNFLEDWFILALFVILICYASQCISILLGLFSMRLVVFQCILMLLNSS